jgi:hypothetical protein
MFALALLRSRIATQLVSFAIGCDELDYDYPGKMPRVSRLAAGESGPASRADRRGIYGSADRHRRGGFCSLQPGSFATGQVNFEDQGRARILLRNKGLMNVYAETATGRFLGAEMLAPGGEHLAHLLAWALQNRITIEQMLEMPYYHPMLEEGLRTALHDVNAKLRAARRAGSEPA